MLSVLQYKRQLVNENFKKDLSIKEFVNSQLDVLKYKLIENSKLELSFLVHESNLPDSELVEVLKEDRDVCREIVSSIIEEQKLENLNIFSEAEIAAIDPKQLEKELVTRIEFILSKLNKNITNAMVSYTSPTGNNAGGNVGGSVPSSMGAFSAPTPPNAINAPNTSQWSGVPAVTPNGEKKSFWKRLLTKPINTIGNVAKNFGKHVARGARRWAYDDPTLENVQNLLIERTANFKSYIVDAGKEIINYIKKDYIPKYKAAILAIAAASGNVAAASQAPAQAASPAQAQSPSSAVVTPEAPKAQVAAAGAFFEKPSENPNTWSAVVPKTEVPKSETPPEDFDSPEAETKEELAKPDYDFEKNKDRIHTVLTQLDKLVKEKKGGVSAFPNGIDLNDLTKVRAIRNQAINGVKKLSGARSKQALELMFQLAGFDIKQPGIGKSPRKQLVGFANVLPKIFEKIWSAEEVPSEPVKATEPQQIKAELPKPETPKPELPKVEPIKTVEPEKVEPKVSEPVSAEKPTETKPTVATDPVVAPEKPIEEPKKPVRPSAIPKTDPVQSPNSDVVTTKPSIVDAPKAQKGYQSLIDAMRKKKAQTASPTDEVKLTLNQRDLRDEIISDYLSFFSGDPEEIKVAKKSLEKEVAKIHGNLTDAEMRVIAKKLVAEFPDVVDFVTGHDELEEANENVKEKIDRLRRVIIG